MAKLFSAKFKAAALKLLDAGVTTREAQAQLRKRFKSHVGEGTLRAWAKAAKAAPPPELAPEPEPAALAPEVEDAGQEELDEDEDEGADLYERTRRKIATMKRRADLAERDGNHTAAQRYSKQESDLMLLLARLEEKRKTATDAVTIPRAEIERARQDMRARVAALAADLERTGGLVCSHCGREIRIMLARGDAPGGEASGKEGSK